VALAQVNNDNTMMKLEVDHLAEPEKMAPGTSAYVVWIQSNPGQAQNVGALTVDNDRRGNSGTIAKFNRMGYLAGFGSRRLVIRREGTYHDSDPRAAEPRQFRANVGEPGYSETWDEGVSIFHNPRALHPLDPDLFPGVAHHFLRNGRMEHALPDFHPYASVTTVFVDGD
jgi:hypothetical protein